ncbi:hypothetical protein CHU98_g6025 [Xylaria longipes]|nr:hypothetical protein CHU98_g6025 [Xylaria longipes]
MSSVLNSEVKAWRPTPLERLRITQRRREAWQDVGDKERTVLEKAMDRAIMDPNIPARDKILLRMRTEAEDVYRDTRYSCSAYPACLVKFPQNWLEDHEYWEIAMSCINTMTALYILDDQQRFPYINALDIEAWFWRQWFRPYTTDIELDRSFVQIFALGYETSIMKGSDIRSDGLISLHSDICEQSERFKEAPLFRALFMVLVYPKEQMPWPEDIRWVAQAQVQLILTGITDGLSAPICFDEIQEYSTGNSYTPGSQTITTTLDIATKFILRLEQREVAAFGVTRIYCQDSVPSKESEYWILLGASSLSPTPSYLLRYREEAKKLGWVEERDGSLDDLSPISSEWVDQALFPKWFGRGALETLRYSVDIMRKQRKWPEQYTKDWWWNHQDLPESPNTHDAEVCRYPAGHVFSYRNRRALSSDISETDIFAGAETKSCRSDE